MFWKAAAVCYSAALLSRAQPDGPIPRLNSDPRNTSNPRLVGKTWPYDELPYQVDTVPNSVPPDPTYRGPQYGYNRCNDSTYGPESRCQTLIVNSLQDFCLYAPHTLDTVGSAEPSVVAYCTQPTHGTRLIPPGTIKGAQFIRTPSYIEFTGIIDQTLINIREGDGGGEVDSGGQDARGNPLGGMVYSNNMPSTPGVMTHARMWHEFIGSNMFCMKFCDEEAPNASGLCRHTLDTLGCFTNVPASYREGVFLSCEGEDQAPVQAGVTAIPASSNCQTFQSTDIWPLASTSTSTTASSTSTPGGPGGNPGGGSGTTTSGGSSATQTGGGDAAGLRAPLEFTSAIFAVAALLVGAVMI